MNRIIIILFLSAFLSACSVTELEIERAKTAGVKADASFLREERLYMDSVANRDSAIADQAIRLAKDIDSLVGDREADSNEALYTLLKVYRKGNASKSWIIAGLTLIVLVLVIAYVRKPVVLPSTQKPEEQSTELVAIRNDVFMLNGARVTLPSSFINTLYSLVNNENVR